MNVIGKNIKYFRKKRRLSQKQLAEMLDFLTQENISSWEKGKTQPKFKTIPKLCQILEITPNQLFRVEEKGFFLSEKSLKILNILRLLKESDQTIIIKMIKILLSKQRYQNLKKLIKTS